MVGRGSGASSSRLDGSSIRLAHAGSGSLNRENQRLLLDDKTVPFRYAPCEGVVHL
jgi:hypothetical protein